MLVRRLWGTMGMTDRYVLPRWLAGYEAAWRSPGTESLAGLFTSDATYLDRPTSSPLLGWMRSSGCGRTNERAPDEVFTRPLTILAVDDPVAGGPGRSPVRGSTPPECDLWVIRFAGEGRCTWFEEWPDRPGHPHTTHGDLA